jgi:hypothetical protein
VLLTVAVESQLLSWLASVVPLTLELADGELVVWV